MSHTLVQINFTYQMPVGEYLQFAHAAAERIAAMPGLIWKLWLLNEEEASAGGIYLFASAAEANSYVLGPVVQGLAQSPAITELSIKQSGVVEELTAITHGAAAQLA